MLPIENVNHVGIRVSEKQTAIGFYELLGFELLSDVGFESGHPVIMKHPSGVVINILGPADSGVAISRLVARLQLTFASFAPVGPHFLRYIRPKNLILRFCRNEVSTKQQQSDEQAEIQVSSQR